MAKGSEPTLRDVLGIKKHVYAGDFKVELSQGFAGEDAGSIADYVVTEQLAKQFGTVLNLVRGAVSKNSSYGAYLHGSYGAGKSHFLTILHAILNGNELVREKPRLREVVAGHEEWLTGKKFLMVPYHLVGAANLESALLGGYVRTVANERPEASTPAVFKSDALLADAASLRSSLGDEAFARLLPVPVVAPAQTAAHDGDDELPVISSHTTWTTDSLDAAFRAPAYDQRRKDLVSALTSGPMKSYAASARDDANAYISLDDGLSVMSHHAQSLGYDGVVLFLDELILWLQARLRETTFVNDEVQKLVKLIESSNADRPVPIISFISRQRDLSQLLGSDILGSDVRNMEESLGYLNERFTVVDLEDRNLPEIIKGRVLRPVPGMEGALESAFANVDRFSPLVKDILRDDEGATRADWEDFRAVYPLSPALLNVLVALSGALQRSRSGLKLVQQLLEANADAEVGRLIPLGDLWDVLVDGTGAAFTDKLKHESEAALRFHLKARGHLLGKYGSVDHPDFIADDRFVKTLLLAALAPDVPALRLLTGTRIAGLNHGSVNSRTVPVGQKVVDRLRELQGVFPTELRSEGSVDPVFSLHLSDLDIEPLLESVAGEDRSGSRRMWVKDRLWEMLEVRDADRLVDEREIVWRGTRRTVEFVYGNVRDSRELGDEQFTPATRGNIRFVFDYPFDEDSSRSPSSDYQRVVMLRQSGVDEPVLVWLPDFFSEQRKAQLGRLMRIAFLLERNRLLDYTRNYSLEDREKARRALEIGQKTLTGTLVDSLGEVYGVETVKDGTVGATVPDRHVQSLLVKFGNTNPEASHSFLQNVENLAGGLLAALYPKHPDFGPGRPVTLGDLKATLEAVTRAVDNGNRAEVDAAHLRTVKRIVEPLELGTVHDGPLVLQAKWRTRINQSAAQHGKDPQELGVEDIRRWITDGLDQGGLGYEGLDKNTVNLLIACYALLDDRAWTYHGAPNPAPELSAVGPGWSLRSQPLPSEREYEAARSRAAVLFGVHAKPALFARNVNKLAQDVLEKVQPREFAVAGVRSTLKRHATLLDIEDEDAAPRRAALREAATLLSRLTQPDLDPTGLTLILAEAESDKLADADLAQVSASAADVMTALDATDWRSLGSVNLLRRREDSIGDRSSRLLERIVDAARPTEHDRSLIAALKGVNDLSRAIVEAALESDQPVHRPHPTPQQPYAPPPATDPDELTLTENGTPSVSAHPRPRSGHRLLASTATDLEALLFAELGSLTQEIKSFRAAFPNADIELIWRAKDEAADRIGND